MIGFVCAISASLAVVILITVSSLLGYVDSILPKAGLKKITDTHYQYSMGNVFINPDKLNVLTASISAIEEKNNISLQSQRPVCNYGFNRPEREMLEVVTFNFLRVNHYYGKQIDVLSAKLENYESGINYCYLDIHFEKNI